MGEATGAAERVIARVRHAVSGAAAVPAVATLRVLAGTTGLFYLCGGAMELIGSLALPISTARLWGIRGLGAAAIGVGLATLLWGRLLPRAAYHLLVGAGTGVITAAIVIAGGGAPSLALAAPYFFVIIDCSFLFSWRGWLGHVGLVLLAGSIALSSVHLTSGEIALFLLCLVVVAVVVAWLARVADGAEQDSLTGLLNRRGVDRRLEESIENVADHSGRLALILMDVDHFKEINDSTGHQGGDRILTECATRWRACMPPVGALGRYGGDEFAVILADTGLGLAADLADELRAMLPDGVTVSAGVAAWQPGDSASTLMGRADVALYDAKSAGRDQTAVYGDPSRAASELEAAIAAGELELHFQPVVRLADRSVVSREALVRWRHPRKGLIRPAEFVPHAERTGAIHSLGAWTLLHAGETASRWNLGRSPISVSVNVSVQELRSPDYARTLRSALAQVWLPPQQLVVEVTEAVFDAGDPQVARSLQALRTMGVQIAIDDFGSGYSSLRWLDRFPCDIVKIDAAFIRSIDDPHARPPILEAILAVGNALGLTVVAEGVETESQASVLHALGCEYAQGYLFGRPEPVDPDIPFA